jgi:phenylacetate-CoA ligase
LTASDSQYFDEAVETLSTKELKALQSDRLKAVVNKVYHASPFYRKLYDAHGVKPYDIKSIEDIRKLPFLEKATVRTAYPFGMVTSSRDEVVEVHGTSGTTGKSVLVFATRKDLDFWGELNARELWMVGLRPGDSLLNAYGYGLPTGGFGFHYGATKMGVMAIPTGSGQTDRQIELLDDLNVTAFCMTPSFAVYVGQRAVEKGINLAEKKSLRIGLFGAEPWPWSTRERIEELFGITAYDEFGMTEFLGPGMSCECQERNWMHTWADAFLCECIDPQTGEPVDDGKEGELVWTTLGFEGTTFVRYRSRDLSALTWEPCACGRQHPRIAAIKGRSDDAISMGGLIVFPSQVESVLVQYPEVGANFRMFIDTDERGLDRLTLKIEVNDAPFLGDARAVQGLTARITDSLQSTLGVTPKEVTLLEPDALPRVTAGEGKTASARVEDRRQKAAN